MAARICGAGGDMDINPAYVNASDVKAPDVGSVHVNPAHEEEGSGPIGEPWFLPVGIRAGILEAIACIISGLVYVRTLTFDFVYDDVPQILKNPAIQSWRYLPQYWTSHVWAAIYPHSTGNYYRPLFLLWLRVNYVLFGDRPMGWHATSVFCNVAATWLVFRLAQQLTRDRMIGFVAAVIFGLHPAHVENVAWISGVTDPLMACFFLGSCFAYLKFSESRKTLYLALSLGMFACALMAKETAIVLPLLILALSRIDGAKDVGGGARGSSSSTIRDIALYAVLGLIYIGVRHRVLGGFAHPTISISWKEVLLSWPSVLWFYAKHLIMPIRLSEFYSLDYVSHFSARLVLLPLSFLLASGVALYFLIRVLPQKQALFALALIVVPLLPVLDLGSLTTGDIVHDRYLYLPSAGLAILAALSVAALRSYVPASKYRALPALLTGAVCALFMTINVEQQGQWRDDVQLYTRGMEMAPDNLTVRDNLANALLGAKQPERAISLYLEVLKRNPNFWRSNYNLGVVYYNSGNAAAAEPLLQRAIRVDGSDSDQYIYLALAELQLKRFSQAVDAAREAIARNPQAQGYHFILGLIDEAQGDWAGSIAAFRGELAAHPDNAAARAELQKVEQISAHPTS
jgi:protein O-mannosyl-transferase